MKHEEKEAGIGKKMRSERTALVFVLILGIILGGILSVYLVFPEVNKTILKENESLKEKNTILEKETDALLNCMQKNSINYYTECK